MLALSLAPLRKLFSFRKPKKISDNDNPPPPVEPSSPGTPIPDVCAMLPESHPVVRPRPLEEPSNLPLEARIVGPPKSRFVAEHSKAKALPAVPQEIGNRGQGGRWGPSRSDPVLQSALTGARYMLANAARALPIQTGAIDVDTLPEITVDDPEAASVGALSSHLKGPSAVANGYSPFNLPSPGAVPPPAETSQQGLLMNAYRLHFGNSHVKRFISEDVESTLGDTAVHPSADVSESDASMAFPTNPAPACVVGGLWTNTAAMSSGSDSAESDNPKGAVARLKYTGPYVHTMPAPIELPAPPGLNLRLPPGLSLPLSELRIPEALFPPIRNPSPVTTPSPSSPPYEVRYLGRGSAAARHQEVLIGRGASAEVFRVTSSNGMYRVIKKINLKKVDRVSLEALKTELTVLTIIKRDQMDAMHCIGKPKRGLEFMIQIPLDIPHYIAIEGNAKQLLMYSEYYPENLDMFSGVIKKGTPAALMKNILYFIISEITQGLAYLHRQHVVHMDLKLENIFLTATRHCVVGDFGGAIHAVDQVRPAQSGVPSLYQTYTTVGFRAPEVTGAAFDRDVVFTCKADFWSLGVCVYKLLVPDGVYVTAGEAGNDYMKMGLVPWVMRKRLAEAGCPKEIVELVLNMTQFDPVWRIGEIGITRHLKKRNRYYTAHHPSPLQLLKPQENPIRPSRFRMQPTGSGDDPASYLNTEDVTNSLIETMAEICEQVLPIVTYNRRFF